MLGVIGHELAAFGCEAVDVRRAITEEAPMIGADIEDADVIAHYHKDIGLLIGRVKGTPVDQIHAEHKTQEGADFGWFHGCAWVG